MSRSLCLGLCLSLFLPLFSPEGYAKRKEEDVMLRILKQEPAERAVQIRMKDWEKETGFPAAFETYRKKEAAYQKAMREWEKALKLKKAAPEQSDKLTELSREADRLWKEKIKSFVAALQAKTKALQMERKHQILEAQSKAKESDKERAAIPKPLSH